jgi:hypothetical protein
MNIIKLNTIGDKEAASGGGKSNYKYYDCLFDVPNENGEAQHGHYLVDNVKAVYTDDDGYDHIMIAPEAWSRLIAVAVDTSKRIYYNNKWMSVKEFLLVTENFDMDAHPEITEEEFYHVPTNEEVLNAYTSEEIKVLFEKLLPIAEKYKGCYDTDFPLPTAVWFKSLLVYADDGYDDTHTYVKGLLAFEDSTSTQTIYFCGSYDIDDFANSVWSVSKSGNTYSINYWIDGWTPPSDDDGAE